MRRALIAVLLLLAGLSLAYFLAQTESPDDAEPAGAAPSASNPRPTAATSSAAAEFLAAELRSALTAACSADFEESADSEWTQEEIQAQIGAYNEQKRILKQRLAESSSAEHLHVAALLEEDPVSRFELLDRALSLSPSDPLLVWSAVRICSEDVGATACPLRDWERLLVALDGQNSESWVRVAANRYAAKEADAALEAMRYAATAAESRAYWTETVELIERGLAAGTDFGFPERAGMAFGIGVAELPRYGDYFNMCKERSAENTEWAYVCLAYGELVENQGKSDMAVSIARSIQRVALESMGEAEKAAQVQQQLEADRQARMESANAYNPIVERLLFSNPTLFSSYLAAIRSVGEQAARRQITAEIERLTEQQPGLACAIEPDVR